MRSAAAIGAAAFIAAVALAGCAPGEDEPAPPPSSNPSATTPSPTATTPAPAPSTGGLVLYYVAYGDEGAVGEPIGCGDSLIGIVTDPATTDDSLREAMERLLADPGRDLGTTGLHSAIPGGTLAYVDGGLDADGTVTVELTGLPSPAGECDNPRIEAQLERTAMAAVGASDALVRVDGVPIDEVLSLDD